jgi:Bax inhibitor 1
MDTFYSTSSSSLALYGGGWGYDSLKNFRQIYPAVQTHLKLTH